jgi:hypothetical protein
MPIKVNKCPNCNGTHFYTMGDETEHAVLVSAKIEKNGKYTLDQSKVLGITPVICEKCSHVLLFKNE